MTTQETEHQERLGGDAPVRFSARPAATNGSAQPRHTTHRTRHRRRTPAYSFYRRQNSARDCRR